MGSWKGEEIRERLVEGSMQNSLQPIISSYFCDDQYNVWRATTQIEEYIAESRYIERGSAFVPLCANILRDLASIAHDNPRATNAEMAEQGGPVVDVADVKHVQDHAIEAWR
jgi:hypothetical protein